MRDVTADKIAKFQMDGKHLRMPKEGEFRVDELLSKAGSGLFK